MDFSIKELQFLNKHLDFITASRLKTWLRYHITNHTNLSDVEIKEAISNAIIQDERTFNPNKGSLLSYLKHSIIMDLIRYSMRHSDLPKHYIVNSMANNKPTSEWIDLSYFSDEEIHLLYSSLTKRQVDYTEIKEIIDEYSKQIAKRE